MNADVRPLPRGRHAAPRAIVWRSQHERMLVAMAEAVADRGYVATSVGDVVERAGVSRSTFYQHFSNKEDCFVAAYDRAVDVLLDGVGEAAQAAGRDPRAILEAGMQRYLALLAQNPAFACTFLVEILAAGPRALERRAAAHERFADQLRALHPDAQSPLAYRACVGAVNELTSEHLRTHGAQELPSLADDALDIVVALLVRPA